MESQPQNPEFRKNPENFHPCPFENRVDPDPLASSDYIYTNNRIASLDRLFVCGLTSQSTAMVMSRWSVNHLTTLFLGKLRIIS